MTSSLRGAQPPVCFVGHLPPPLHGMAAINASVVERLRLQVHVFALNTAPNRPRHHVFYDLDKGMRALSIIVRIMAARMAGARSFYGSVDDGLGGLWTSAFVLVARLCGYRLFLHHHSFRYVDSHRRVMELLTKIAGQECCHVVLCKTMGKKLELRYHSIKRTLVVPNEVSNPVVLTQEATEQKFEKTIVLGLLSNLMFEKGVVDFVRIVEQARAEGINVRGILAGPAWNAEVEAFIVAALARNGSALRWIGPVFGQSKEDFFAAIELFVFPTKYPSEAYPLVLLEALIHGRPIIAPDRGCIGSFRPLKSATIVDAGDDFVAATISHLASLHDGSRRPYAAFRAHAEGTSLNAANHAANKQLVDAILAY